MQYSAVELYNVQEILNDERGAATILTRLPSSSSHDEFHEGLMIVGHGSNSTVGQLLRSTSPVS